MFIVDYAVNDAEHMQITPTFRKKTSAAETHSKHLNSSYCSSLDGEYRDRLMISTERLIRWTISLPSKPAVLIYDTFNPRVSWHKQAQEVHTTIASYYQIPVISYRDAVWHKWRELERESRQEGRGGRSFDAATAHSLQHLSKPSAASAVAPASVAPRGELCGALGLAPLCAEAFWTVNTLHPAWHVHQLLSDLLALTLVEEHRYGCSRHNGLGSGSGRAGLTGSFAGASRGGAPDLGGAVANLRIPAVPPLFGGEAAAQLSCAMPLSVVSTLRTGAAVKAGGAAAGPASLGPVPGHTGWRLEEDTPVTPLLRRRRPPLWHATIGVLSAGGGIYCTSGVGLYVAEVVT
jgi:hypothetical protein